MSLLVDGREFSSLREVHDWARRTLPEHVTVQAAGVITGHGTAWSHPVPLTVRGGIWDGEMSDGWWLSWRTAAPLLVEAVEVMRFRTGGLDAGHPERHRGAVAVRDSVFREIGGGPGYAAVFATDCDLTVEECEFRQIEQDPQGPLVHCVYAVRNTAKIAGCRVSACSGDAFRARDGSVLEVDHCSAKRAGVQALASCWRQADEQPSQITVRNSEPGTTYLGRPSRAKFTVR